MDDNGTPISGVRHGSFWYHGTEASTCSIPSEQYSDFVAGSFSANVLATVLFAGHGTIAIAPDGLGYGESYDHFKGYLVKKAYEASAAVLWSKARQVLQDEDQGIELGCSGMTSGYSEGGYGATAGATGLSCIGVGVKRIQMGGKTIFLFLSLIKFTPFFTKQFLLHLFYPFTSISCPISIKSGPKPTPARECPEGAFPI